MSGIDVHDLAKESLPTGRFPIGSRADFRLFVAPEAHRGMWEHAKQDLSIEICGVLVGRWERDDDGPYAVVTNYIRCDNASSKFAEVTFTHESWAQINREMDTRFAEERIIGWYHSHPDFGIFLSERDCFIQQHFFGGPGQIAYVIDPVRGLEGAFAWRGGTPTPLEHYWVGEKIRTVEASQQAAGGKSARSHQPPAGEVQNAFAPPSRGQSPLDLAATVLSWLALFLLGYLVAGFQSRWEKEMLIEGTVAHYGLNNLAKIGLEQNLAQVRGQLLLIGEVFDELPASTAGLSEPEVQNVASQRTLIANNLAVLERALGEIQQLYGLSDEQREAIMKLFVQKHAEMRKLSESAKSAAKQPADKKPVDEKPTADQPAATAPPTATNPSQAPAADDKSNTVPR